MYRAILAATFALPVLAWEPIRCPEVDRTSADRFETVRVLSTFEDGMGTWKATNGGQQPKTTQALDQKVARASRASLRVDAVFGGEKKLEYINVGPGAVIEKPGIGVGFWFRWTGTPVSLRMRIADKSGETHQMNLPRDYAGDPSKEWCYVATKISSQSGSWGGDGNHKLDYPCMLQAIVGDRPKAGFKGNCTLWLDDVALVRERKRTGELKVEVDQLRLGNLYQPGNRVSLRATGSGDTVTWEWRDFFGNVVGKGTGPIASATLGKSGYYQCILELRQGDAVVDRRIFRCAALPAPTGKRNDFLGFCTHFQRVTAWPSEGLDLFARYGFGHLRDELSWGSVEKEKGRFAIDPRQAAYLARSRKLGIEPLLILDYANRHYDDGGFPNSEGAIAGFARYSGFLVKELADRVDTYEIWNEWTVKCGMRGRPGSNSPENYARLLQASHAAIKRANPQATVVGIGGEHSGGHIRNIEGMMRGGGAKAMDSFSVHSYRYPRTPEETDLAGEILAVSKLAKDCGAPERVWVTEIGWPTHTGPRGSDEFKQARMMVRTLSLLWGTGVVDRVYWYDFKNDGFKREYNENNFGVVWHQGFNWAPKPAVVTAAVFAALTQGCTKPEPWNLGDAHGLRLRRPDGTQLAIVWSAGEPTTVGVKGVTQAWDLMGNPTHVGERVALGENPIYLMGGRVSIRP
ncbi:MAG: hypothetical protein HN380_07960 [Victivallales bacterium]|jgi:hypothetical protein|nr:hypothetical protein [Victivallales bacterium]